MLLKDSLILWNPARSEPKHSGKEIMVVVNGSRLPESKKYRYSGGGCYAETQDLTPAESMAYVCRDAMTLIVRDNMNPQAVHDAFCEIKEYRDGLSPDTQVPEHLKKRFMPWRINRVLKNKNQAVRQGARRCDKRSTFKHM